MRRAVIVLVIAALAGAAVAGGFVFLARSEDEQARAIDAARSYLTAWEDERWDAMTALVVQPPANFTEVHQQTVDELAVRAAAYAPGRAQEERHTASVPFTASLTLAGLGEWTYENTLELVRVEDEWRVRWDPSVIHPSLRAGLELDRSRERPKRAPILGHDGEPIVGEVEVVEVGVQPSRITDLPALLAVLEEHLGVDPAKVEADLNRPAVQPDWFVPVKRLRPEEYAAVEDAIYPVPGTVFQRGAQRLPPADGFAAHLLGRAGEITRELLDEMGERYQQHDVVGLSGLERAFEDQLGGEASGEVRLVDPAADGQETVEVLHRFEGRDPVPLQITLDVEVQAAAEAALEGVELPAAIVAVSPGSGEIRATVSRPLGEFNRALAGRYPPGSTFKVVTAAAALGAGTSPDETFTCPAEVRVGGRVLRNAGGDARGEVSFRDAFAYSCNTVFGPLAARLDRERFADVARDFGFGVPYADGFPVGVRGGAFPVPGDDAEAAAAGIGQARVEASPLHMATVAAAVAADGWRPPRLLGGDLPPPPAALDPGVAGTLREMMEAVVTRGTGTAAAVPGAPIAGKTGSAEFDTGDPPPSHAWFIGFDDSIAVAVLVDGGGAGGSVAAPIAARFFTNLRQ